jgi:hypothetical protein
MKEVMYEGVAFFFAGRLFLFFQILADFGWLTNVVSVRRQAGTTRLA